MTRRVALLGAGFSRNWGGWLATELIGELCGRLRDRPHLVEMLRREGNFESVLGTRRQHSLSDAGNEQAKVDVVRFQEAIQDVFFEMNMAFARGTQVEFSKDLAYSVISYLAKFDAIFTLNQDMWFELHYEGMELMHPGRWSGHYFPGIEVTPGWMTAHKQQRVGQTLTVAKQFQLQGGTQPIFKLHGSTHWRNAGGAELMVVGTAKESAIAAEELLRWYFEQFEKELFAGGTELMAIGYGFADQHINELLIAAGRDAGLGLYLVDPRGTAVLPPRSDGGPTDPDSFDAVTILGVSTRPLRETFGGDEISHASFRRFIGT